MLADNAPLSNQFFDGDDTFSLQDKPKRSKDIDPCN
jgi:hypothetical protein